MNELINGKEKKPNFSVRTIPFHFQQQTERFPDVSREFAEVGGQKRLRALQAIFKRRSRPQITREFGERELDDRDADGNRRLLHVFFYVIL